MARPSLTDEQRITWLRLARTEQVGPISFFNFINRFGSAENALEALPQIASKAGSNKFPKICSRDDALRELDAAQKLGVRHIAAGEPDYPTLLRQIDDPPPFLLVRGDVDFNQRQMVAIVGSRNTSIAGQKIAAQLANRLMEEGYVVVSGLARGIDTSAHKASLIGGTIAVMAGGHANVYPPENLGLSNDIVENHGAIVSETPPWLSPRAQDFPRRNRIVSGLCSGVVIVEAARRSGSLITARLAGEQNRQVFAVPGSPLDPRSEGTNRLIREGATLIRSAEDIIEDLRPSESFQEIQSSDGQSPFRFEANKAEDYENNRLPESDIERIAENLSAAPVHIDDVVRFTGLSAQAVVACLCELEFSGRIERLEANMFKLA
ncbi:MAG: DNA-processing protein DprA [Hyphomicrobiales bacterium]